MKVKIEKFDDLGRGLTRIDNKVCFVKYALPNEIVDIEVIKDKKSYSEGKVLKVIKKSNERIEPICKHYFECGGCEFLHTTDLKEKEFKISKANNYFKRCDFFYDTSLNYRNKVTFHVQNGKIGYYKTSSHTIVEIDYCYLLKPKINEILKILNKRKDDNFNGEIIIRENHAEEIIVVIKGKYKYLDSLKEVDLIDNLIYNNEIIKGKDYFIENIMNYKFKVHYNSFFQVNRLGLEDIYKILKKYLQDKKINTSLDLYSGTSVLGILMSKYAKKVISIEENKYASRDALDNKRLNNIKNLEVINGKVEDYIDMFKDIDLILFDPSRRGSDSKTLTYINSIKPKYLIYISCEAISLKRDLEFLKSNYEIDKIYLINMFKKTRNFETFCLLKLKD